ncbi:tetratricopeptide repeat protein [Aureliella helgolandensis]|uniref:Tetratricopeptide repeat protein n=2 Tax=Aureliella helgolandensis TaxID=2527968 RepID=A0A518GA21_9BACT|nr:tetratricopeptide repeat protein [Aureliella helgolandensis]
MSVISLGCSLLALGLAVALFYQPQQSSGSDERGHRTSGEAPVAAPPPAKVAEANETSAGPGDHRSAPEPSLLLQSQARLPNTPSPATKEELETEAEWIADQLIAKIPENAMALHVGAVLNTRLHRTQAAEDLWKRCIELDPQGEIYYLNLAANALDRGDSQLAVDTIKRAMERGLESADAAHHLAIGYANLGMFDQALDTLNGALSKWSNSGALILLLGQTQLKAGQAENAEASLRKALALGADSEATYFALANACMRNGNREAAKEFREIYSAHAQTDEVSGQERYKVLSEQEARGLAIAVCSEAAAVYRTQGFVREPEQLLLRILALEPENLAALISLAEIYSSKQQMAEELMTRERIIEVNPTDLLNYLRLAKTLDNAGLSNRAIATVKLAISMAPMSVPGYAAMSEFLLEKGELAGAQWYVTQALALRPSVAGYQLLARILRNGGHETDAQAAEALARKLADPKS